MRINKKTLTDAYLELHREGMNSILSKNGLALGNLIELERSLYVTEKPDSLFIDYRAVYEANDITNENRTGIILELRGEGIFDISRDRYENLRNLGEGILTISADKTESYLSRNYYGYVGGVIGHRDTVHTVRFKLQDEP